MAKIAGLLHMCYVIGKVEPNKFRIRIHVTDFYKYTPLQLNSDHYTVPTWFVTRVSDPDSIRSVDPDPDPGGQKRPTKVLKWDVPI